MVLLHVVLNNLLVLLGALVEEEDAGLEVVDLRQHHGVVLVVPCLWVLQKLHDQILTQIHCTEVRCGTKHE
jgi:hypothetical protein